MTQRLAAAAVAFNRSQRPSSSVAMLARVFVWSACGVVGVLVVAILWFITVQPVQVLPRIQPLPPFSLQDQQNRWLTDSELRGQVLVVSFGYSRCGTACDATTMLMQAVHMQAHATKEQSPALLTIDLDSYDTSATALHDYVASLGATSDGWRVLRGEPDEIKELVGGGFGIYYQGGATPNAPPLLRDQRVVLIDANGVIRAEYEGARLDPARVVRDIGLVRREAASTGLTRSLYRAAHLFVCYAN